jgi:hypothetical protein
MLRGVLSGPLDPAQETARPCRMDIDVISTGIGQSAIEQALDLGALGYVAKIIEAHIVGIIGPNRDKPVTHNIRDEIRLIKTLAGLVVNEYRARCPIDAMRLAKMIGAEQYRCSDLGFRKTVSAGCGAIGDLAKQQIAGVITARLPEPDGARSVHWDAAKTDHWTPSDIKYGGAQNGLNLGAALPASCYVIQA